MSSSIQQEPFASRSIGNPSPVSSPSPSSLPSDPDSITSFFSSFVNTITAPLGTLTKKAKRLFFGGSHPGINVKYYYILKRYQKELIAFYKENPTFHLKNITTSLELKTSKVVELLNNIGCDGHKEIYPQYVKALRIACSELQNMTEEQKSTGRNKECAELISNLVYVRFADMNLYDCLNRFLVKSLNDEEIPSDLTFEEFGEKLKLYQKKSKYNAAEMAQATLNVELNKACAAGGIAFDPGIGHNTPYERCSARFSDGKEVRFIRQGSPTEQFRDGSVEITADYRSFIEEAYGRGEKILQFIVEQDSVFFGEPRFEARFALNEYENYLSIVLPLDNDVFLGEGDFKLCPKRMRIEGNLNQSLTGLEIEDSLPIPSLDSMALRSLVEKSKNVVEIEPGVYEIRLKDNSFIKVVEDKLSFLVGKGVTLKEQLLTSIKKGEHQFKFPAKFLEKEGSLDFIGKVIDDTFDCYFKGEQGFRDKEHYQAFICIFYSNLYLEICKKENISLAKFICKDGIDRANALQSIVEMLLLFSLEKEDDPESLKKLIERILTPPLLVKSQGILDSRLEFIEIVYRHLLSLKKDKVERKKTFGGVEVQELLVKQGECQLIDRPNLYGTAREYWEKFEEMFNKGVMLSVTDQGLAEVLTNEQKTTLITQIVKDFGESETGQRRSGSVTVKGEVYEGDFSDFEEWLWAQFPNLSEASFNNLLRLCQQATTALGYERLQEIVKKEALGIDLFPLLKEGGTEITVEEGEPITLSIKVGFQVREKDSKDRLIKEESVSLYMRHVLDSSEVSLFYQKEELNEPFQSSNRKRNADSMNSAVSNFSAYEDVGGSPENTYEV